MREREPIDFMSHPHPVDDGFLVGVIMIITKKKLILVFRRKKLARSMNGLVIYTDFRWVKVISDYL